MLSYTLLALFSSFALITARQLKAGIPTPPALCESDGKLYSPGDYVPTSNKCMRCHCGLDFRGSPHLDCTHFEFQIQICYNPVDNGHDACQRFTCSEHNCKTPSGHVLFGDEEEFYNDDGLCRCPHRSSMRSFEWTPDNGMAICEREHTPDPFNKVVEK